MWLSGLCSAVRTVLIAWLQLFVADSGGVALMFAITVVPTIGVVGLAVDLSLVTQSAAQLNFAADAGCCMAMVQWPKRWKLRCQRGPAHSSGEAF
jgi:Flp pilus assembly protein TadG